AAAASAQTFLCHPEPASTADGCHSQIIPPSLARSGRRRALAGGAGDWKISMERGGEPVGVVANFKRHKRNGRRGGGLFARKARRDQCSTDPLGKTQGAVAVAAYGF